MTLPSLIGLSKQELTDLVVASGQPAFRAKQLWQWIYTKGAKDFDEMTSLAKELRHALREQYSLARPDVSRALTSRDGTRKWLLRYGDGNEVETVYIPEEERGALCVSSQVGCTLTCTFCHTGTMPLVRNLTAADIVGQFMLARDDLNDWDSGFGIRDSGKKRGQEAESALSMSEANSPCERQNVAQRGDKHKINTIVMMGMGEPLFNYDNVAKALLILMDKDGINLSKRRITLSTSGVVPAIERCGKELEVNLAISLHAVTDELRDEIVPINKKWPLKVLLEACKNYPAASNARRITFEYVMLKGVNDSDADARALVKLMEGIHAKINLIPFNPWPGSPYECSSNNRMHAFAEIVNAAGYSSPIRTPRGRDIYAACGQLKSESERKKGEKVKL